MTLGNAIELSVELKEDWLNFVLLAATTVAVTRFHVHLLVVLLVFGAIGVWRYRAKATKAIP